MKNIKAAWFGAGFVVGATCTFLLHLAVVYVVPILDEPSAFEGNPDENVDGGGPNKEKPATDLHARFDNKKLAAYVYNETGPTAYLLRAICRSRHGTAEEVLRESHDKSNSCRNKKVKADVAVTVTELDDDDTKDIDQSYLKVSKEDEKKINKKRRTREDGDADRQQADAADSTHDTAVTNKDSDVVEEAILVDSLSNSAKHDTRKLENGLDGMSDTSIYILSYTKVISTQSNTI